MAVNLSKTRMCRHLHRRLGCLCRSVAKQAALCGREGERANKLHRTIQQHLEATSLALSEESVVVFEEGGESHWSDLVLHPPLQRVDTLGLMQMLDQPAYSPSFTK